MTQNGSGNNKTPLYCLKKIGYQYKSRCNALSTVNEELLRINRKMLDKPCIKIHLGRINAQMCDSFPRSDCNSLIVVLLFNSHRSTKHKILFNLSAGTLTVLAIAL